MKYRANKMLAVAILTGGLLFAGADASAATFKDLKNDFWAEDEINYLVDNQIIKGFPDGTFHPNQTITKAQAATMLVRSIYTITVEHPDPGFKDVPKTHPAYYEIATAVAVGIFEKGEKFNPNEEMTRAAIAEAISKAFNLKSSGQVSFKDVPATASAYQAIASLAEHDITTGYEDGTFKPNQKVTRAEFSVFLARALDTDYLPNKYNVPFNVNPAATFFHDALKNPEKAQDLFADKKFDMSSLTKDVKNFELIELQEVARANGQTEFIVKVKAELKEKARNSFLKEGENQLYIVIKRDGYMDFKIVSVNKESQLLKDQVPSLSTKEALQLFKESQNSYWYVVMGGEGKRNEETFTYDGTEYRYMAESLNTLAKLKTYLGKTYTENQVESIIKQLRIIEHQGILAQPNADGGSILNWEKAKIQETSSSAISKKFTLNIPLGDSDEMDVLQGELRYEQGKGWRVQKLESVENEDITSDEALQLFKESQNSYWYVVMGGEGKRNQKTFTYKGKEYRYMAESLNTMAKLKTYLGKTYTADQMEAIIKQLGIIEYKGALAQPNADGGSALNWEKAKIQETLSSADSKKFILTVPIGDSKDVETLQGELRYEEGNGWRVYKLESVTIGDITTEQALQIFAESQKSYWYVVMGGEGKRNEATFTYNGKDYRYMAESLNTMAKLKAYLGKTYTTEQVEAIIKQLGIIEYKGVLAQPNADGGSALNWEKAKIKEAYRNNQSIHFEIDVPIGDSSEYEELMGELVYDKEADAWLVNILDQRVVIFEN